MKITNASLMQVWLIMCLITWVTANIFTSNNRGGDVVVVDTTIKSEQLGDTIEHTLSATDLDHLKAIIAKYGALTSCKQLAFASLFQSCADFDKNHTSATPSNASPTAKFNIDEIENIHAARLAICELGEVTSIEIPATCQGLAINTEQSSERASLEHIQKEDLQLCMVDLHKDARSWTSYTNSKQNIFAVCKSARADLEKDTIVDMVKDTVAAADKSKSFFASVSRLMDLTATNFDTLHGKSQALAKGLTNLSIDLDAVRVYLNDEISSLIHKFTNIMTKYEKAASTAYDNAQKQQESSLVVAETVNTGMEAYRSEFRGLQQSVANLEASVLYTQQSLQLIAAEQQVMNTRLINASTALLDASEHVSVILTQFGATLSFFNNAAKQVYGLLTSPYLVGFVACLLLVCIICIKVISAGVFSSVFATRRGAVVMSSEKV